MTHTYQVNQPIDLPDGRLGMVARVQHSWIIYHFTRFKLLVITSDGQVQEIYR